MVAMRETVIEWSSPAEPPVKYGVELFPNLDAGFNSDDGERLHTRIDQGRG